MATYKTIQNSSLPLNYSYLTCDICGSAETVSTTEGYVCRECGIVLEIQKLQYDRPYNEDLIQYAKGLGITKIGTKRERGISPNFGEFNRLNRHNSIISNEKAIIEQARLEISRILNCLDLTDYDTIKEMALEKFKEIRTKLRPGLKYRNTDKLVSIVIYFCLKLRNVSISPFELIEVSKITKKEFKDFNLQIQRFLPQYADRNRKEYILHRVYEIAEHFDIGMSFYYLAKKIMYKLWSGIKNTTDNALAGLVSSISLLCLKHNDVSVSAICNRLGIRMSTIQSQVKKKIFERYKIDGFISLIKSSDLLVKVIQKLGLIDASEQEDQEDLSSEDYETLIMGNATKVFNTYDKSDYYYFALRGENRTPLIITLKMNDFPLKFNINKNKRSKSKFKCNSLFDFEVYKYYNYKGPPPICKI
ncbi:MAG: hypothetical protein ACFFA4_02350 [Promethearchaeota archaeon]